MYNQITSNKRKTIFLIGIFIIFILLLGWFFGNLYNIGYYGLLIAIAISMSMSLFSYFKGDKVALLTAGAKQVKKEDNPYVYRMVENLSITAGIPTPKVHIINDKSMNAFACGRDPSHASIAITTGIIEKLENEELEGVIAHELSHIKNYDIRIMTIVIILVGIIALLADFMLRAQIFGFGGRDKDSKNGTILLIVGLVLMIVSPLIAKIIQLAVSRKREFLADADGALLTRYPEGLASALEKISTENIPTKKASNATAHLYFSNPFSGKKISKLFSTHPPAKDRIAELRKM